MASQVGSQHWLARNQASILDVDGDYSTAAVVATSVKDMRDYEGYVALVMTSALTGAGPTLVELIGCEDSDGTGNITQLKSSGAVVMDAVGDFYALEVTAEELRHLSDAGGYDLRYIGVRLTNDNAADECVAFIARYGYKHGPKLNLTAADNIS